MTRYLISFDNGWMTFPEEESSDPADHENRGDKERPERQNDVGGEDEDRAQENGKPSPPQRLLSRDANALLVHGPILWLPFDRAARTAHRLHRPHALSGMRR